MKKVYLAAPFEWIDRMRVYAEQLRILGYEVTSRWMMEQSIGGDTDLTEEDGSTKLDQKDKAVSYGIRDLRNIIACDTLIEFNPGRALIRNTRVAELGAGLALGKNIIVIGPENPKYRARIDNIFVLLQAGTLPDDLLAAGIKPVQHYDCWGDFLEAAVLEAGQPVSSTP